MFVRSSSGVFDTIGSGLIIVYFCKVVTYNDDSTVQSIKVRAEFFVENSKEFKAVYDFDKSKWISASGFTEDMLDTLKAYAEDKKNDIYSKAIVSPDNDVEFYANVDNKTMFSKVTDSFSGCKSEIYSGNLNDEELLDAVKEVVENVTDIGFIRTIGISEDKDDTDLYLKVTDGRDINLIIYSFETDEFTFETEFVSIAQLKDSQVKELRRIFSDRKNDILSTIDEEMRFG